MALQTYACPACGSRKSLADAHPGEKIHCTCGMSFPASPVFAVAGAAKHAGGPSRAVATTIVLLVGCGAVAIWLLNRSPGPSPDHGGGEVAVIPQPINVRPTVPDEGPAPVPVPDKPVADTVPPPDVPAPEKPLEPTPPPPPPALGPPVASVSAVTLWDAYDADVAPAVAARYSDKVVEVKARGKVARDSIDRPYFGVVVVKGRGRTTRRMTPDEQRWEKEGYPPSVRCYLSAEQAAILEKAPEEREVVLRGVCAGRKDRDDVYRGYIVELDNCVVAAPK
jgi:hypothetical protein